MIIGFVIWSIVVLIFGVIGVVTWKADKAVGFFTGAEPPAILQKNIEKYNHAVAMIWFVLGIIFELLGVPFLFLEQNSPYFILVILGTMFSVIGMMIAYFMVKEKYMKE